MILYLPKYASPKYPGGIIPPSPPAEWRHEQERDFYRENVTYTGRLPKLIAPGYAEGVQPYSCMPLGVGAYRSLKPIVTTSSLLTDLKFSYSFETTGWLDNLGVNNLTGTNTPSLNAGGKIGNCIAGTGGAAGPYASVAYNAAFNSSNSSFTVASWEYQVSLSSFQGLWSKSSAAGSRNYCLFIGNDSQFRFIFIPVSVAQTNLVASNFGTLSLNTWYFVLCSFDLSTNTWSISVNNGTPNTVVTGLSGVTNATDGGFFVMWDNSNNMQNGRTDELNKWNRLLLSSEITQLAAGISTSAYPF